ncbi:MAG TPA: hypothetical protein VFV13_05755 [Acidimicrobiia bacterium]|nr:hypothetical protein [Acidimicrobiia bacterium]
MHETGLMRELMRRAELEVGEGRQRVKSLHFEIGALSGVGSEWVERAALHYAREWWGYTPEVLVEQAHDPTDPHALGVTLRSVRLGR